MKIYKYTRTSSGIVLRELDVIKCTPRGYWFKDLGGFRRWTSGVSRTRYAWPTPGEAAVAFGVPIVAKNQLKLEL